MEKKNITSQKVQTRLSGGVILENIRKLRENFKVKQKVIKNLFRMKT
jgi:predicted transcriptional regulator